MTKVNHDGRSEVLAIALLAVILILVIADLVADWGTGVDPGHLLIEVSTALVAAGGVVVLIFRFRSLVQEQQQLLHQLAASQQEAERWQNEASDLLAGLATAIDRQFDRWRLTPAEREIALFLLRGLSFKEVARAREASERTVRQQAHLLYRKAGLSSRADLAAFFLGGMLQPEASEPSDTG